MRVSPFAEPYNLLNFIVKVLSVALGLTFATPAHATLQLGVSGHFKGYVSRSETAEDRGRGWHI